MLPRSEMDFKHKAIDRMLQDPRLDATRQKMAGLRHRVEAVGFSAAWRECLEYFGVNVEVRMDDEVALKAKLADPNTAVLALSNHDKVLEPDVMRAEFPEVDQVLTPRSIPTDITSVIHPQFSAIFMLGKEWTAFPSPFYPDNINSTLHKTAYLATHFREAIKAFVPEGKDPLDYVWKNLNQLFYHFFTYAKVLPSATERDEINAMALVQITNLLMEGGNLMICPSGTAKKPIVNGDKPNGNMKAGIAQAIVGDPQKGLRGLSDVERQNTYLVASRIEGDLIKALLNGFIRRSLGLPPGKPTTVTLHLSTPVRLSEKIDDDQDIDSVLRKLYNFYCSAFTTEQEGQAVKENAIPDWLRMIALGMLYQPSMARYSRRLA